MIKSIKNAVMCRIEWMVSLLDALDREATETQRQAGVIAAHDAQYGETI